MSDTRNVDEYRVRIAEDETCIDGTLWVRRGHEWELQAGNLQVSVSIDDGVEPYSHRHFHRLRDALDARSIRLQTCGTCVFFRRRGDGNAGGYCTWHETRDEAYPAGSVSILSPNCHRFVYRSGPAEAINAGLQETAAENARGNGNGRHSATPNEFRPIALVRRLLGRESGMPAVESAQRSGSQPCPCCGTSMINRGFVSNVDDNGEERVFSVWRCPKCESNYLDDYREAYVGSRARDGERIYAVPPAEAEQAVEMAATCPRPFTKGCTCTGNRWFDEWGEELAERGRRIAHRESVVWL